MCCKGGYVLLSCACKVMHSTAQLKGCICDEGCLKFLKYGEKKTKKNFDVCTTIITGSVILMCARGMLKSSLRIGIDMDK